MVTLTFTQGHKITLILDPDLAWLWNEIFCMAEPSSWLTGNRQLPTDGKCCFNPHKSTDENETQKQKFEKQNDRGKPDYCNILLSVCPKCASLHASLMHYSSLRSVSLTISWIRSSCCPERNENENRHRLTDPTTVHNESMRNLSVSSDMHSWSSH